MLRAVPILVATCVACSSVASRAETVVIGDFDDGTTQGWVENGSRTFSVVPDQFTGCGSLLAIDWSGLSGFDWTLGLEGSSNPDLMLLNNTAGPQILEFDIYWDPPSDWSGDGWMEWRSISYNYAGGWTQLTCGGCFPNYQYYYTFGGLVAGRLTWDFIAEGTPMTGAPSPWAQLFISTNLGDNDPLNPVTRGTFYIDNIAITVPGDVPDVEPALFVDFGVPVYGVPPAHYEAPSNLCGSWNDVGVGVTALNGATGLAPGVTVNVTSTGTSYPGGFPNNNTEALLRDYLFSSAGDTWNVDLTGLDDGDYVVFLYAPSDASVPTGDMTVGGEAVASIPGHEQSMLIEGESWVSLSKTITSGSLAISGTGADFSGLAGLQLVMVPEPDPLLLMAGGLTLLALFKNRRERGLRTEFARWTAPRDQG